MKKPTISELRNLTSDPKALDFIKKNFPQFANMSEEDFKKVAEGVGNRLAEFQDKFGDLNPDEVMDMNRLHHKDLKSYPLSDFTSEMSRIKDTDTLSLMQILNSGDGLVSTKKVGFSDGIRYVYVRRKSMLYTYSMKDSTDSTVVLSLASVSPFTKETIAHIIVPAIQEYDKVFRVPEKLVINAEKIVCINPGESSHEWRRLSENIEKKFENALGDDPKSILYMEAEPMEK